MKFCFLLFLVTSLPAQAQTSLFGDSLLTNYYSERELEELTILVDFFDDYVIRQTGESDLQLAYEAFNKQQAAKEYISLAMPLDTIRVMFAQVNLPVWNSTWAYSSYGTYRSRDSVRLIVPGIDLKLHDAYWEFLLALSETDKQLGRYTTTIQQSGTLSPILQGLYFDRFNTYKVDFNRAANRLVAAVHYLTFHVQVIEQPQ